MITRDSPEGMEEPMWRAWFPDTCGRQASARLSATVRRPGFENYYHQHLRKLLLVRGGNSYVSKNNYQLPRAEFLWTIFADAEFVIPTRHPVTHVASLARQHQRFLQYAREDVRVGGYLKAVGHYEFGPQRLPLRLDEHDFARVLEAWSQGKELLGYAIQWKQLYAEAQRLLHTPQAGQVHVVRHEDLCRQPKAVLAKLLSQVGLAPPSSVGLPMVSHIDARRLHCDLPVEHRKMIWQEVEPVAKLFGYRYEDCESHA